MSNPEYDFASKYFDSEPDLLPFLRARGLTRGVDPSDSEVFEKYQRDYFNALNDFAIMVNARNRQLTVIAALRNLIQRKLKIEAYELGFNTKFTGGDES
jgi:hypothetical protein